MPTSSLLKKYEHDFAISVAGEDRNIAEKLLKLLEKEAGVFYDGKFEAFLLGKDMSREFKKTYSKQCHFFIAIVSKYYSLKDWTRFEFEIAIKEAKKRKQEFILPIRVDSTALVGLAYTVNYLDLRKKSLKEIAKILIAKLSNNQDYYKQRDYLTRLITRENVKKFNEYRSNQNYSRLDLSQVNLGGFWKIKNLIRPLDLSGITFKKVNFDQSDLSQMRISDSDLTYCSFYLSNLSEGKFNEVNLSHVFIQQADLYNVRIIKCDLFHSNFSIANLFESFFRNCYIYQAYFSYAKCNNSRFMESVLYDINFNYANITEASFNSSVLLNCTKFKELICEQASFTNAIINNEQLVNYLRNNGAKNVPDPTFDLIEIRRRLIKMGLSFDKIEKVMKALR